MVEKVQWLASLILRPAGMCAPLPEFSRRFIQDRRRVRPSHDHGACLLLYQFFFSLLHVCGLNFKKDALSSASGQAGTAQSSG
jgi:hypothetical protein